MNLEGTTVRHLRIVEKLGEGGMGEVYLGTDERLGRQVAVKAVRSERRMHATTRMRFLREARVLSQLEHPHICRIYEFVEEDDYDLIVLELVHGQTMDQVDDLDFEEKLKVAEQIAQALSSAHSLSVIHRDLKPQNVMITPGHDAKVLDFGLARGVSGQQTEPDESDSRRHTFDGASVSGETVTAAGRLLGTPGFMSPEQARGEPATAASDMFSLGVMLHWLFTGKSAFGEGVSPDDVRLLTAWGETERATDLPPDLAMLIEDLKASDPRDRPTADTACERLQSIREAPRRAQRRRLLIAVAASLVIAAVSATAGWIVSSRSLEALRLSLETARQEQERADREAASAEQIAEFLVSIFQVAHPEEGAGGDVTARELLARGADRLETELAEQPVVKARLMHTIGQVYLKLGLYPEAIELTTASIDLREAHLGRDHLDTAASLNQLGAVLVKVGRFDEAEELYRRALRIREAELGEDHPMVTNVINNLAGIHFFRADYEGAAELMERIVSIEERTLGPENPMFADSLSNLGILYRRLGRLDDAEVVTRRALVILEKTREKDNPAQIHVLENLANLLDEKGQPEEAEILYLRALDVLTQAYGPRHPSIAGLLVNLGVMSVHAGRLDEAEAHLRKALSVLDETVVPNHPRYAGALNTLAFVYQQQDRFEDAEPLYRRALEIFREIRPPGDPQLVQTRDNLAKLLRDTGRTAEAEALVR